MKKPSKPSGTQNPQNVPKPSTTSWTTPEPGDVIAFSYLWLRESDAGREEGVKDRPTVVILATEDSSVGTRLLVAPVTHSEPRTGEGTELPQRVKQHLGLDDERSWVVTTEVNSFIWPGPDVRMAPGETSPHYGAVPAKLLDKIKAQLVQNHRSGNARTVRRTE